MKILLAGMASDTAALLEKLLTAKGHELAMTSGVGAIEAVRAGSRFVVVEEPPDMTAPELCRRIRDVPGGDDTVILVVSPREEEIAEAVAAGASDFFLTSLGSAALAARLLVAERRVEKHADLRRQRDRVRELTDAQKADARFQALLESAPDAMVIAGPDGRIALVNRQAEALFGYARDELVGQTIEVLLPPRFHDTHTAERGQFFSRPARRDLAARAGLVARRKDGTEFPVEISLSPLQTERGVIVSSVIRDISERQRVEALLRAAHEDLEARVEARTAELSRANEALLKSEQQLRQSQKMEAIGVLAGGVAHDFNNLLTVILSHAQLLQGDLDPDDARRADVAEIEHAAARAAELTRQLLAFSRRQVLKPRVVDVNEVVHGIEKMLRRLIGEDIELSLVSAATTGKINVDVGQIENVVVNLVVNARDAMPQGGKLSIETADVDLLAAETPLHPAAKPGPHVMLAVRDTGTGMDEATRTRIFEPFFTTKGTGKGTGLGLSTVLGIVEQSEGFIVVRSERDQGTSFEAYFPRAGGSARTAYHLAGRAAEILRRLTERDPSDAEAAELFAKAQKTRQMYDD